ncbi:hypothetical protein [uncultured Nostoc sp.]|uniref:hypothetical protein n=1 Tax=uncultured Nostoc sp. TaxID=340711 RepID=UPI0035CA8E79
MMVQELIRVMTVPSLRLRWQDEKLHPLLGWSFWAWGMGKKLPMPNAPSDGATIPLHPLKGWSFPSLSMNWIL